jgi:hypothetical protein
MDEYMIRNTEPPDRPVEEALAGCHLQPYRPLYVNVIVLDDCSINAVIVS